MSAGDRHHLGDGDPVEAVHEVDEVHEPDAAEDEKSLLHARGERHPAAPGRRSSTTTAATATDLQQKAQAGRQGTDVVDGADDARAIEAAATITNGPKEVVRQIKNRDMRAPSAISAAPTTAMPPPCGVGILWLERAFGRASA